MKSKLKSIQTRFTVIVCVLVVLSIIWVLVKRLEGENPLINTEGLTSGICSSQNISVSVSDKKSGIRKIRILLRKGRNDTILYEKKLPGSNFITGGSVYNYAFDLKIEPRKLNISNGPAVLIIDVRDYAWRHWWHGNRTRIEKEVVVDTLRPKVEILSQQHNISQGGSGLVIYKLSEPCPVNGVYVGDNFFPGHSAKSISGSEDDNIFICFIALSYKQGKGSRMFVQASDRAGNTTKAGFPYYIRSRNFKKDIINISDNFLNQKMPEFEDDIPEGTSDIEKFLFINRKFRSANTSKIKKTGEDTDRKMHWKDSFLRLPNSARRANFADHREYRYKGEKVDEQNHMGIDLASIFHAPVPASNAGRVAFTGFIGIYGNTIMIDHGFGLFSAYSHLSHMGVEVNQMVAKGEIIGNTGLTGLAAGDHLHFGMIVHNTFVNPVEWWDSSWIKNNITNKMKEIHKKR